MVNGKTTTDDGDPYPELPAEPISEVPVAPYRESVPVFFGHYWLSGTPEPTSAHTVCVDYSAANGGPLVAYRWSGEAELLAAHFAIAG